MLLLWASPALVLVAGACLSQPFRRIRLRVTIVATVGWLGIFAFQFLDTYVMAATNGIPISESRQRSYQVFTVLPVWCTVGLLVLWGCFLVKWWNDRPDRARNGGTKKGPLLIM